MKFFVLPEIEFAKIPSLIYATDKARVSLERAWRRLTGIIARVIIRFGLIDRAAVNARNVRLYGVRRDDFRPKSAFNRGERLTSNKTGFIVLARIGNANAKIDIFMFAVYRRNEITRTIIGWYVVRNNDARFEQYAFERRFILPAGHHHPLNRLSRSQSSRRRIETTNTNGPAVA